MPDTFLPIPILITNTGRSHKYYVKMSTLIKNVAVAGATGNTGPTVIKTLTASGFEVTALTRSTANAKSLLGPGVKIIEVDYLSHESLVFALRGNEAVVVCGVGM